jgi:hypothetical protein
MSFPLYLGVPHQFVQPDFALGSLSCGVSTSILESLISRIKIYKRGKTDVGMKEAEHKTIPGTVSFGRWVYIIVVSSSNTVGGPVDDNVDNHVLVVNDDLLSCRPLGERPRIT